MKDADGTDLLQPLIDDYVQAPSSNEPVYLKKLQKLLSAVLACVREKIPDLNGIPGVDFVVTGHLPLKGGQVKRKADIVGVVPRVADDTLMEGPPLPPNNNDPFLDSPNVPLPSPADDSHKASASDSEVSNPPSSPAGDSMELDASDTHVSDPLPSPADDSPQLIEPVIEPDIDPDTSHNKNNRYGWAWILNPFEIKSRLVGVIRSLTGSSKSQDSSASISKRSKGSANSGLRSSSMAGSIDSSSSTSMEVTESVTSAGSKRSSAGTQEETPRKRRRESTKVTKDDFQLLDYGIRCLSELGIRRFVIGVSFQSRVNLSFRYWDRGCGIKSQSVNISQAIHRSQLFLFALAYASCPLVNFGYDPLIHAPSTEDPFTVPSTAEGRYVSFPPKLAFDGCGLALRNAVTVTITGKALFCQESARGRGTTIFPVKTQCTDSSGREVEEKGNNFVPRDSYTVPITRMKRKQASRAPEGRVTTSAPAAPGSPPYDFPRSAFTSVASDDTVFVKPFGLRNLSEPDTTSSDWDECLSESEVSKEDPADASYHLPSEEEWDSSDLGESKPTKVLKYYWPVEDREPEEDIIRELRKTLSEKKPVMLDHLPRLYYSLRYQSVDIPHALPSTLLRPHLLDPKLANTWDKRAETFIVFQFLEQLQEVTSIHDFWTVFKNTVLCKCFPFSMDSGLRSSTLFNL